MTWTTSGRFVLDVARESLRLLYRHLATWATIAFASSIATRVLLEPAMSPLLALLALLVGLVTNAVITRLATNDLIGRRESPAAILQALLGATARLIAASLVVAIAAGLVLAVAMIVGMGVVATIFGRSPLAFVPTPGTTPPRIDTPTLVVATILSSVLLSRFATLTAVILERREGPLALLDVAWSMTRGYSVALAGLTAVVTFTFLLPDLVGPTQPLLGVVLGALSSVLIAAYGAVFYVRATEQSPGPAPTGAGLTTPARLG
jgi:hypothetical protein